LFANQNHSLWSSTADLILKIENIMSKAKIQDKQLDDLDELCMAIAQTEHDNWAIIERYRVIQTHIDILMKMSIKKNGGDPLASEAAIRKRVEKFREMLGPVRKPRSVSGQAMKQRLTHEDKCNLTWAMINHFDKQGIEEVTLDDINEWLDEPRKQGTHDIRDDLKVRGIHISQVRWFDLRKKIKMKSGKTKTAGMCLYSDDCYESKGAGAKSSFNVKRWKKHLAPEFKTRNDRVHGVRS
jgi:hypothetical protein